MVVLVLQLVLDLQEAQEAQDLADRQEHQGMVGHLELQEPLVQVVHQVTLVDRYIT